MSMIDKVEARSSVELTDSCNCTECCPRVCSCIPWGRKVVKHDHKKVSRQDGHIDITATGIKVVSASQPHLTESGQWELQIDGNKVELDPVQQSIIDEHGGK